MLATTQNRRAHNKNKTDSLEFLSYQFKNKTELGHNNLLQIVRAQY